MDLEVFSLFKVEKGWQLNIRQVGERGFVVRYVSNKQASEIFSTIGDYLDRTGYVANRPPSSPPPPLSRFKRRAPIPAEG